MSSQCGTYAGYQRHRKAGEAACDACKKAQADYVAAWRRRTTSVKEQLHKATGRARWAAISRLIDAHPDEWERLFAEERGKHPELRESA